MIEQVEWERCGQQVGTTIRWIAKCCGYDLVAIDGCGLLRDEPHRMRCGWSMYGNGGKFPMASGSTNHFSRAKAAAEAVARIEAVGNGE